jgi:starvation-inducible DNA-binding protein
LLQACHWNIKGDLFFDLHVTYGEHYALVGGLIDTLAERIVGLKGVPISDQCRAADISFIDHIESATDCRDGKKNNKLLTVYFQTLSEMVSSAGKEAFKSGDLATFNILVEQAQEIEKLVWMYRSFGESILGDN